MKRKVLAGLVFAGVLSVAGTALADVNVNVNIDNLPKYAANTQTRRQPPEFKQGERPPMPPRSGDRRPPDGKRPPMSGDRKPPKDGDRRMPPPGAHSFDKRPDGQRPPMPQSK